MPAKKMKRKPAIKTVKKTARSRKADANMLSIWYFVGLMLTVLGVIVTLTGVYYIFSPQHETKLAELNPSLWWGCVILVAGLIFLITSWKRHKAGK
jgi:protein-S-isoprenylcysteine O-methyltransferase Ste14